MKAVGILVGYYPSYAKLSAERFSSLIRAISDDRELWFVNNAPIPLEEIPAFQVVPGDNRLQEFTAWDAGLVASAPHGRLADNDIVVLANDTFCNHHPFSGIDQYFFVRAVKRSLGAGRGALVGEVNTIGERFEILGLPTTRWVSTYLFAMRWKELRSLLPIALDEASLGKLIKQTAIESEFFQDGTNLSFRVFIRNWLFDPSAARSWYKASPLTNENSQMMFRKARAILNEQNLSGRALMAGYQFENAHANFLYKIFKKLRRLTGNILKAAR
jgi:hypothetical protein